MQKPPFFAAQINPILQHLIRNGSDQDKSVAWTVSAILDQKTPVIAFMSKPLNRYAIQPGKVFGKNTKTDKFKIVRLIADDVVIQNVATRKVEVRNINELLKAWSASNYRELNFVDELIGMIKSLLGPYLGVFLTASLVTWLVAQLNRE